MLEWMKKLVKNQAIRYIFFGGCTTLVNVGSYALLRYLTGMNMTTANFLSIGLAILFAYVVNKWFVFERHCESWSELAKECGQFIGMRLGTMFLEVFGVILLTCVWGLHDMVAKLAIQVVVLVLNYVFSKIFVFREKRDTEGMDRRNLWLRKRRKHCYIWGFSIPFLTMAVAFAVNQVYPFGDHGVLIIDSLHQYLPFFTEFHEKLVNSESLLYSFGGGLGFNFWATYAYYLASPLNFLVALFPKENMMDVMALFIVLKIGLCGLTMTYYLTGKDRGRTYFPILFGAMFALSSFMIGYYFNLMWLDSIAMLPLVMMGIDRIVKGENGRLFCLSLFYGIYCNYYIGFMLCFFACLYFLVTWISQREYSLNKIGASCVRFGWYALLAGGMAAIVLLPAYMALSITESMESGFPDTVRLFVQDLSQLTSQFAFVDPINIADDQIGVNAFCGTLTLIFAVLYALDCKIGKRERAAKLLLCVFLYAGFNVNVLNYIWHGFHTQNGLPNRFAFIYIAMLLVIGFDVLRHVTRLSYRRIVSACLVPIAFVCVSAYLKLGDRETYVYLLTLILLLVYSVLLLIYRARILKELTMRTLLMSMGIAEMVATGIFGVCVNGTVGRSTYLEEQKAYEALMEASGEEGFFRSDIDSTRMRNEDMFLGGNGVVLFSSTMPAATVDLCKSLGMEARTNKNGYNGLTKLVNDIFGVRYVVSRTDAEQLYQMDQVDYVEPLHLYKNDRALSLGFMVDSKIKEWDIHGSIPTDVQNDFVTLATGQEPVFSMNQSVEMEDGGTYNLILPAGNQVYLQVTEAVETIEITTPQYVKSYDRYNDHLYDLGSFDEDTLATVTCTFKEGQTGTVQANVYLCAQERYTEVYEELASSQLETTRCEDGTIRGSIRADQDGTLLLSVPYDTGWSIRVDGQEVEAYRVGEALTGIDLTEGTHEIAMDYTPQGLWAGSFLTFLSVALYFGTGIVERKREKIA